MKGVTIEETKEIFKQLSPENQAYFMALVKVAEAAETSVKKNIMERAENFSEKH